MLTHEQRMELSDVLRPASPPQEVDDVYTQDQGQSACSMSFARRGRGSSLSRSILPRSAELIATMSGAFPEGVTPLAGYVPDPHLSRLLCQLLARCTTPVFKTCFYNAKFLEYWLNPTGRQSTPSLIHDVVQCERAVRQHVIPGIWIHRVSVASGTSTSRPGCAA